MNTVKSWSAQKQDRDAERALLMREAGMTLRDIADECKWSYSRVGRLLVRGEKNRGATMKQCLDELKELRGMVYVLRVEVARLKGRR